MKNVIPTLVGQPASVKINANIGTSLSKSILEEKMDKLQIAFNSGVDAVMDLSTGGDLYSIRHKMLDSTGLPLGTVPIYAVAQKYIQKNKDPSEMSFEEFFEEIEHQAEQGVDFMTLHCGVTLKSASLGANASRALGIVSRGGAIIARWMLKNKKENPLYTEYERLLKDCKKIQYNNISW